MRGVLIREHQVHAAAVEEADEVGLVLLGPGAAREAGAQLTDDNEWHEDLVRSPEPFHRFGEASCEIDITVRVDRDSHRQSAGSTRSWASMASSKPGTSTHAPTRGSRSRCTRSGRSVPSASRIRASRNTSLRLLRAFCALRLSALSTCAGTLRTVYWTVGTEAERFLRACSLMQALYP